MKNFIGIILARKGSKAIKNKNLISISGKPLIEWTINQCKSSNLLDDIWVSSDSNEILDFSKKKGAKIINRPKKFATSKASSEDAWLHAIKEIEKKYNFKNILALQPTSPIRDAYDIDNAIKFFKRNKFDSIFSSSLIRDYFIWVQKGKKLVPNYSYRNRKVRQDIKPKYLENGSFFLFNKNKFKKFKCRFFGRIGTYTMDEYKRFQLDEEKDKIIIEGILNYLNLKK